MCSQSPHKREGYNDYFEKRSGLGVNDLILSIETKRVYTIHAFCVKKQVSQVLTLTAVVCTTWLGAYRACKRA